MSQHTTPTTADIILDLLTQAASAHGVHEAEVLGGVYDIDWPQWYADHMARALAEGGYRIDRALDFGNNGFGEDEFTGLDF